MTLPLLHSKATGKLMHSKATGKLLYGDPAHCPCCGGGSGQAGPCTDCGGSQPNLAVVINDNGGTCYEWGFGDCLDPAGTYAFAAFEDFTGYCKWMFDQVGFSYHLWIYYWKAAGEFDAEINFGPTNFPIMYDGQNVGISCNAQTGHLSGSFTLYPDSGDIACEFCKADVTLGG